MIPVDPLKGFTFNTLLSLKELQSRDRPLCSKSKFNSLTSTAIDILDYERPSQNFIADTINWFLNSMSVSKKKLFAPWNQNFKVT